MKIPVAVIGSVALILAISSGFSACSPKPEIYSGGVTFGAELKAVLYCDKATFAEFSAEADRVAREIGERFDENVEGSFANRFNGLKCGGEIAIGAEELEAFEVMSRAFELTDGAYDPTAYNLVDLWGFSPRFENDPERKEKYDRERVGGAPGLPDPRCVELFKAQAGFEKIRKFVGPDGATWLRKTAEDVEIDGETYSQRLDFGGVAKGLAVKALLEICRRLSVTDGYIGYGASSAYLLGNNGKDWDVLLTDPRSDGSERTNRERAYYELKARDVSVSTSGDYERFYFVGGRRYCHVIDMQTGEPTDNGARSVTVICDDPALGDCVATGLLAAGREAILKFAKERGDEMKVISAFGDENECRVFSDVDGKILKGAKHERGHEAHASSGKKTEGREA